MFAEICRASHSILSYDNVMAGWGDKLIEAHAHDTEWKSSRRRTTILAPRDTLRKSPKTSRNSSRSIRWKTDISLFRSELQAAIGNDVEVIGCINSPFVIASEIRGYESLIVDTVVDQDCTDRLLSILKESSKMYSERIRKLGLETIFMGNGTAGAEQTTLDLCERVDLRYLKTIIDDHQKLGLRTIIYNCSAAPDLGTQAALDPTAIHFNNKHVNLKKTFDELKGKICVIAGVDR